MQVRRGEGKQRKGEEERVCKKRGENRKARGAVESRGSREQVCAGCVEAFCEGGRQGSGRDGGARKRDVTGLSNKDPHPPN